MSRSLRSVRRKCATSCEGTGMLARNLLAELSAASPRDGTSLADGRVSRSHNPFPSLADGRVSRSHNPFPRALWPGLYLLRFFVHLPVSTRMEASSVFFFTSSSNYYLLGPATSSSLRDSTIIAPGEVSGVVQARQDPTAWLRLVCRAPSAPTRSTGRLLLACSRF